MAPLRDLRLKLPPNRVQVDLAEYREELRLARSRYQGISSRVRKKRKERDSYLRQGSEGGQVRSVQEALAELGYDVEEDGVLGEETEAALREFQDDTGASVDGVVGPETLGKLERSLDRALGGNGRGKSGRSGRGRNSRAEGRRGAGRGGKRGAAKGTHGGTIGPSGKERASATTGPIGTTNPDGAGGNPLAATGPGAVSDEEFERLHPRGEKGTSSGGKFVKKGDSGEPVAKTQQQLDELGYKIKKDGEFGPRTENAVRDFQQENDLLVDGIVGPKTQASVRRALRKQKPRKK